ncbi:MAG TPA: PAS domain S-box protein [Candidatus Baltobacteraceae bacterium]|nr:PAS domain S-box protein [Candidatus Baltobacteraceae bacterium]
MRQMKGHGQLTRAELIELVGELQKKASANEVQQIKHIDALRDSEERLRAILETAVEGIITIDERGTIESFNPAAEKIFGYASHEAIGQNVKLLMPEPFQHEHDGYLESYRQTGRAKIIGIGREVMGRRKDGAVFPMDLSVSEVRLANRRMFTGFVRDITERKQLEKEIIEISNREQQRIGQDLHDGLGQELTGIELMCQVLEQKLAAKSKAESKQAGEITQHIRDAISHTRKLARGLAPVEFEANGLMSALQELAAHVQKIFRVECRFECLKPVLIRNNVFATHLYRIAQEAVNNAIKHGKAKHIVILLKPFGDKTVLTISDDGLGFSNETKKGGGMGLHIMKYRAGVVGAALEASSGGNGAGTTVICIFDKNL